MELYCIYCGQPQGDRIGCCGEYHFVSGEEYCAYTGDLPDDGREEFELYEELERGYAQDRI